MEHFATEIETAITAVRVAAVVCRSVQDEITAQAAEKRDRSPVTVADFASQAIICRSLREFFPDDPIIAEEDSSELRESGLLPAVRHEVEAAGVTASKTDICDWIDWGAGRKSWNRFWTLDPIDGTKGFLRKGQYAISLALLVDGNVQVAVLGCPSLPVAPDGDASPGTSFNQRPSYAAKDVPSAIPGGRPGTDPGGSAGVVCVAARGQGSRILALDREQDWRSGRTVHVRKTDCISDMRLCESVESGHSSHDTSAAVASRVGITRKPLRIDSQAKYVLVGRGEADIYLRLPTRPDYQEKIWDHAGGILFVEEAGGQVSDMTGRAIDFTCGHELSANHGIVVTNGIVHEQVIAALRAETDP